MIIHYLILAQGERGLHFIHDWPEIEYRAVYTRRGKLRAVAKEQKCEMRFAFRLRTAAMLLRQIVCISYVFMHLLNHRDP